MVWENRAMLGLPPMRDGPRRVSAREQQIEFGFDAVEPLKRSIVELIDDRSITCTTSLRRHGQYAEESSS
jgi:hypothetical protein